MPNRIASKLDLSSRQVQVARCVLSDQGEEEIARALGLSRGTVHTHLERLHEKLEVHSRVQSARRVFAAYFAWLIESPPPSGHPLRSRLESAGTSGRIDDSSIPHPRSAEP